MRKAALSTCTLCKSEVKRLRERKLAVWENFDPADPLAKSDHEAWLPICDGCYAMMQDLGRMGPVDGRHYGLARSG